MRKYKRYLRRQKRHKNDYDFQFQEIRMAPTSETQEVLLNLDLA